MNAFDILNENEKRVLSQRLKGLTLEQVADTAGCTKDEVNIIWQKIIAKIKKASAVKFNN
jgi:transcriptional regulator